MKKIKISDGENLTMNLRSIQIKLGLVVCISGLIIISALIGYTTITARNNAVDSAESHAVAVAREYAGRVKAEIEIPMNCAKTLAQAFSAVKDPNSPLNIGRYPANAILQTILKANPTFLASYTLWEPNAFDDLDEKYKDLVGHDQTGRFIPYWTRNSKGEIVLESLTGYNTEGVGDYYLVPKRTLSEAVVDPYFKMVQGKLILIISLVAPITYGNTFYGIAGVDISLEWLQKMVNNTKHGNPIIQIYIISNNGIIAAAYNQSTLVGKHIQEIDEKFIDKLPIIRAGREFIKYENNQLKLYTPLKIGNSKTPWTVNIVIPSEVITSEATSQMWKNIIMSISLSGFVLLVIIFFIRKLIMPLGKIAEAAGNVALGDLAYGTIKTGHDEIGKVNESFKKVVNSLREITSVCEATAVGDFSKKAEIRSENDILGISVNQMAENLRAVVEQANNIAKGDYSTDIRPRSENDELGIALFRMTLALRRMTDENERQNLLKNQRMELNEKMRGEQDMPTLTKNVISYLCHCLDASIGAFYVEDAKEEKFKLVGSFAYQIRKNLSNEFKLGEGLIGQSALEKDRILITSCPVDYIRITSGLGEAHPKNILVYPFILNRMVNSVIEIGSFQEFSEMHLIFLDQVSESIAIAINSCKSRTRMETLLKQTQHQAELLQTQQEELRQTNEELAEQAKALKISELKLQEQQEELRQANEELTEQTQLLEEQKSDIQRKNLELKNARQIIEEKARDLEITSKYKSEFLANMSHELRTPLNSILLLSKMLAENKEKNFSERQMDFCNTIYSAGNDLLNLINEILDLSKVESGKMILNVENVNLGDISDNIKRHFQPLAAQKGLKFIIDLSDKLPKQIKTDQQRLEQILKNFFSNAFKFTSKGSITFKISRPENLPLNVLPANFIKESAIAFSVSDTGIGIPKEKQKIIFEAFQQVNGTTSRKYGGTGLGLSISRELAKLLCGGIYLESEEKRGSCFTIYLPESIDQVNQENTKDKAKPIVAKEAEVIPPEIIKKNDTSIKKSDPEENEIELIKDDRFLITPEEKSILIIEDDQLFSNVLCNLSREKGFKVLMASDGETGLKLANKYKPSAIILDIGLPGISGWSVMSNLKDNPQTRHIPVHFISGSDRSQDAFKMGAIGYLTKPAGIEKINQVYEKIEKVLSKKVKRLLLVENDEEQGRSIIELLGNGDLVVDAVKNGNEAYEKLKNTIYDCMILDPNLPDISAIDLLTKIRNECELHIPVIIYKDQELSKKEKIIINEYAEKDVIKGVESPERLLDETTLFLHRIEENLPVEKRQMLKMIHDKESILKNKKILLADDDMRNVFALTSIMEEKGINTLVGKNGNEAISQLEQNPDIDLVLMDIMMPEMDGYEAMRKIREMPKFAKLPIIALTAKAMKGDRSKSIEAGANDYLTKPLDAEKLIAMLKVWLYK